MAAKNDAHAQSLGMNEPQVVLDAARATLERKAHLVAEAHTGEGTSARRHYSEHVLALARAAIEFAAADRAVEAQKRDAATALERAKAIR